MHASAIRPPSCSTKPTEDLIADTHAFPPQSQLGDGISTKPSWNPGPNSEFFPSDTWTTMTISFFGHINDPYNFSTFPFKHETSRVRTMKLFVGSNRMVSLFWGIPVPKFAPKPETKKNTVNLRPRDVWNRQLWNQVHWFTVNKKVTWNFDPSRNTNAGTVLIKPRRSGNALQPVWFCVEQKHFHSDESNGPRHGTQNMVHVSMCSCTLQVLNQTLRRRKCMKQWFSGGNATKQRNGPVSLHA